MSCELAKIAELIRNCNALLIGAGAGMGVDSGLPDFRGKDGFWKAYPPLAKLGLKFEDMANPRWFIENPRLAWGFYGHRFNLYQSTKPHFGYQIIRNWIKKFSIPNFVFTSNVDAHFARAGWVEEILECHGSLMRLQCLENCGQPVWNLKEYSNPCFEICPDTLTCLSALPQCKKCGSHARPNILMFSDFFWDSSIHSIQEKKLALWLRKYGTKNLLIMEFGAGLDVPTVRFFCESIWNKVDCNMIRVNPRDSQCPHGVFSVASGALETLLDLDTVI